jgi:hypothetical protein
MLRYRMLVHEVLGTALVVGVWGCAAPAESPTSTATGAITHQWFQENFNNYALGALDGPSGWDRVRPEDASPNVFGPITDGTYSHGNVVKMVNKEIRSSAIKSVFADTTGRFQHFIFQARVNDEVPANNTNKGVLSITDGFGAALVKVYFAGNGIRLCGSDYEEPDCQPFFPGDADEPFQRIWYRVVIHIDQDPGVQQAYAEIGVVGDPHIITRTGVVSTASDRVIGLNPVQAVALYEFAQVGGALLLDNMLGFPQQ